MKMVIETQYRENYGAHDWDGEGECPQYWKCKGGSTYVINNITDDVLDMAMEGQYNLDSLIQYSDPYSEEYIIDYTMKEDNAEVGKAWDNPIVLKFIESKQRWKCTMVTDNTTEYGFMRKEIVEKVETWFLGPNGERQDHWSFYIMENGDSGIGSDFVSAWFNLKEKEEAAAA
jgi:hypothetical protein